MESLRGQLLIAGAGLWDPNFRRSVVLVGHHDEGGAVGVVLNRATEVAVDVAVPPLADLVEPGERLFIGGPVQPQSAVVVADFERPEQIDVLALDTIGFLPEEVGPDQVGGIRRARVYAGYAGWGPGQLEAELEEDSWIVEPARPEDVFTPEPEHLWSDVLRRKGPAFDLLRLMPEDPSTN
ncbi:MAG: YqgE/AlgH family protein [Candidatus Velamenicoccus archaeovorus]